MFRSVTSASNGTERSIGRVAGRGAGAGGGVSVITEVPYLGDVPV